MNTVCLCNMQRFFFAAAKMKILNRKIDIFFYLCSKHSLAEVVLMVTHNLCFTVQTRTVGFPLYTTELLYKSGVLGDIYIYYTNM